MSRSGSLFRCVVGPGYSLEPGDPGDYFLDFRAPPQYPDHDDTGIPMVRVRGYGLQYNWTVVQQEAIRRFQVWTDRGSERDREAFLDVANFCLAGLEHIDASGPGWYYRYPKPRHFSTAGPRISGMSQGQGMSVLSRAFVLTGQSRFVDGAVGAFDLLMADIPDGGTRHVTPQANWWFEERPKAKPPLTLNGFVYALFGIADLYKVTEETRHRAALERGVAALKELLHRFDRLWWSLYELQPHPVIATSRYHVCHFNQLRAMGYIMGEDVFLEVASRWQRYYESFFYRGLQGPSALMNGLDRRYRTEGPASAGRLLLRMARGGAKLAARKAAAGARALHGRSR